MQGIGDFAERLINEQVGNIKEGKELPPNAPSNGLAPAGKDISKVKVPDSFMKEVLGENFHPQDTPTTDSIPELVWSDSEEPEAPPQEPQVLTEETIKHLVPLLEEVRDLLKEMTSTGSIGVNMAGPQKDSESWAKMEKKYGYLTAKAPTLPGNTRKQILKQSIRNKLRKK
jgi:hypothetical protein